MTICQRDNCDSEHARERERAEKWREIAYLLYIWEHNQERVDEPDYGTCKPNCHRCDAARKHDALRRYEDDHAPLPKEPKAMSQWARNNPEKVGSDPRTHVPGYGSPASPDEIGGSCTICAAAYAKRIANALAGAATLAENDRQAAELSRYIEAKAEILKILKDDRRDWWDNNMTGISWLHECLIAHIEGREPRRTNFRDDRKGA